MKNLLAGVFIFLLFSAGCRKGERQNGGLDSCKLKCVEALVDGGEFKKARAVIDRWVNSDDVSIVEKNKYLFEKVRMERILKDFTLSESDVRNKLRQQIGRFSESDFNLWVVGNRLENMVIDGRRVFFKKCVENLFRIDSKAKKLKEEKSGKKDFVVKERYISAIKSLVDYHRKSLGEKIKRYALEHGGINDYEFIKENYPSYRWRLRYEIVLKKDVVPPGFVVRLWFPFVRENYRQSGIKLIFSSLPCVIAPAQFLQRTVYMQKEGTGEHSFEIEFEFTSHPVVILPDEEFVRPYDRSSEIFRKYTSERKPHIEFSPELKRLVASITGNDSNPITRAKKIFKWIYENIPWASAREYSTISNISRYCYKERHGDCGIKTLFFITLARIAGIPAKWQSGWYLKPADPGLHDWGQIYFEPYGWVPFDMSFGLYDLTDSEFRLTLREVFGEGYEKEIESAGVDFKTLKEEFKWFNFGNMDPYRMIINDDYGQVLFPAKVHFRSELVDFQRGEVEYELGNLYFDKWEYKLKIKDLKIEGE